MIRILGLLLFLWLIGPAALAVGDNWWNNPQQGASMSEPFLTSAATTGLDNERVVRSLNSFITINDSGTGYMDWDINGQLLLTNGGTGASTQQGAVNNILNYAGKATGDIVVYDGANWSRVAKGANNTFWGVNGSGVTGYFAPAGGGTVTDFSAGDLAPLFTTSEATTTSTPALSFSLSNANAWEVFGRHTGTAGAPSYGLLTASHIPNLDAGKITTGNLAKARSATEGVYNDQTNTYSGTFTQDMSSATQTLLIPLRAAPTTNGAISINSADLEFRASAATHKAAKQATTLTAGTGLTGGGDLSANRSFALSTPVTAANGGTGANLSGSADGSIVYMSSGVQTVLAPQANKYIQFNSGGTAPTAVNAPSGFGGDGSAGAVTKGAVTETTPIDVSASTYSQTVSTTHNLITNSVIKATSTVALNGSSVVGNMGNGQIGQVDTSNTRDCNAAYGPYGGRARNGSATRGSGGGGGGYGNAGGSGAQDTAGNAGGQPGRASFDTIGAGGAGGGDGTHAGGNGGSGGGTLTVCAVGAITVGSSATVSANGAAGSAGSAGGAGGGGGGPGGKIILASQASVTISSGATASVNGGAGGAAAGANGGVGGGGSGGRWYSVAPTVTHTTAPTASGGAAGSGTGTTTGSASGSAGTVVSLSVTPTNPLISDLRMRDNGIAFLCAIKDIQGKRNADGSFSLTGDEALGWMAAVNAKNEEERQNLTHLYKHGEDFGGSKVVRLPLKNVEKIEALRNAG